MIYKNMLYLRKKISSIFNRHSRVNTFAKYIDTYLLVELLTMYNSAKPLNASCEFHDNTTSSSMYYIVEISQCQIFSEFWKENWKKIKRGKKITLGGLNDVVNFIWMIAYFVYTCHFTFGWDITACGADFKQNCNYFWWDKGKVKEHASEIQMKS